MSMKLRTLFAVLVSSVLASTAGAAAAKKLTWKEVIAPNKAEKADARLARQLTQILASSFSEHLLDYARTLKQTSELNLVEFLVRTTNQRDPKTTYIHYIKKGGDKVISVAQSVRDAITTQVTKAEKTKRRNLWDFVSFRDAEAAARKLVLKSDVFKHFMGVMTGREELSENSSFRVEKGDVLLYVDKGWFTGVSLAQGAMRFLIPTSNFSSYKGSIYTHHAAVVTENPNWTLGVTHSTGSKGVAFETVSGGKGVGTAFRLYGGIDAKTGKAIQKFGSYLIYRIKDSQLRARFVAKVSAVANAWTDDKTTRAEYAEWDDLAAAPFHSSSFGDKAKAGAAFYVKNSGTNGLQGLKVYCSQLVIAIYQAALGVQVSEKLMALYANYTSPMKLHHYLASSDLWELVGQEKY